MYLNVLHVFSYDASGKKLSGKKKNKAWPRMCPQRGHVIFLSWSHAIIHYCCRVASHLYALLRVQGLRASLHYLVENRKPTRLPTDSYLQPTSKLASTLPPWWSLVVPPSRRTPRPLALGGMRGKRSKAPPRWSSRHLLAIFVIFEECALETLAGVEWTRILLSYLVYATTSSMSTFTIRNPFGVKGLFVTNIAPSSSSMVHR